jgi:acyl CoA:acetate/3-ketoacid CoA transferase alpha subunit/acyl CoA:acetate/3-ketoacid CoA transferase beta subunit
MKNKVVSIRRAIEEHITPGMTLHIGLEACAAARELARTFWDKNPGFTLIMNMIGGHHALSLIHGHLVKKLIFATCADIFPRPYPNPVIQRAFKEKTIELENWSMLSLIQSLQAGALNLPYAVTRSVIGSSLARENSHSFKVTEDPFGSGKKIGLIKALNPDISLIHGWAADPQGNVIMAAPPRDAWGAKASRKGVIVTVEKLVSEAFIREHSLLVKIPGSLVKAVCVAPRGAHPQNLNAQNLPEFEGYGLDKKFLTSLRKASENEAALTQWVQEWVLEGGTHEQYLEKIETLELQAAGSPSASVEDAPPIETDEIREEQPASPSEHAIIAGAREIRDLVVKNKYKTMFAGIGISGLAGWCAYYLLKEEGYHIDLIAGGIGYQPCPGDPLLISPANMATAKMISDSFDVHGVCAGGINSSCLGVLGAGQLDREGNINSTIIKTASKGDIYLSGAGGGNDIASVTREVVIVAVQRANRLVEKVPYITCPGTRVTTLVTNEGVYVKRDSQFVLKGYFSTPSSSPEERINEIKKTCGWDLQILPQMEILALPTLKELALVRSFDPEKVFIK